MNEPHADFGFECIRKKRGNYFSDKAGAWLDVSGFLECPLQSFELSPLQLFNCNAKYKEFDRRKPVGPFAQLLDRVITLGLEPEWVERFFNRLEASSA